MIVNDFNVKSLIYSVRQVYIYDFSKGFMK